MKISNNKRPLPARGRIPLCHLPGRPAGQSGRFFGRGLPQAGKGV